jgi:hypothetical protein
VSATAAAPAVLDEAKLNAFVGKMIGDIGATLTGALVIIGDRLGLYRALAEHGALTSAELAEKTGTHERYVRDSRCRRNTVLYQIAQTLYTDEPAITEAFKTGRVRLARARPPPVRGDGALLPARLQRALNRGVDPRAAVQQLIGQQRHDLRPAGKRKRGVLDRQPRLSEEVDPQHEGGLGACAPPSLVRSRFSRTLTAWSVPFRCSTSRRSCRQYRSWSSSTDRWSLSWRSSSRSFSRAAT